MEQNDVRPTIRVRRLKRSALIVKGTTAIILLIPSLWAISVLSQEAVPVFGACDYSEEGFFNSLCVFKSFNIVLSIVLLLPFFVDGVQGAIFLSDAYTNKAPIYFSGEAELAPTQYEGNDDFLGIDYFTGFLGRLGIAIAGLFMVLFWAIPYAAFTRDLNFTEMFVFILSVLPDTLLSLALFPLSVYVIGSSTSFPETLVNLVAVQIFAQLDDYLVRMITQPRKSLGTSIDGYCAPEHSLEDYRNANIAPKPQL